MDEQLEKIIKQIKEICDGTEYRAIVFHKDMKATDLFNSPKRPLKLAKRGTEDMLGDES